MKESTRPKYQLQCGCNAGGFCDCLRKAQEAWDRRSRAQKNRKKKPELPPGTYDAKLIGVKDGLATFRTTNGYEITAKIISHRTK